MKLRRSEKEQFLDFLKVEETRRKLFDAVEHLASVLDDVEDHLKKAEHNGGFTNHKQ